MGLALGWALGFGVLGQFGLVFWFDFLFWAGLPFLFQILILIPIPKLTQTKLNSNSNLNPTQAFKQTKEMLQHDATTIKPMVNFNCLRNKIRLNASLNTINP